MWYCETCMLVSEHAPDCPNCGQPMIEADEDYLKELKAQADTFGYESLTELQQALIKA